MMSVGYPVLGFPIVAFLTYPTLACFLIAVDSTDYM